MAMMAVGCIALALLLYLVIGIVNWNDRKPSALAARMRQELQARPAVADAQNGYLYALGFAAAPEQDPVQVGIDRVAWAREMFELNARKSSVDAVHPSEDPIGSPRDPAPRDPVVERFRGACQPGGTGCAEAFVRGAEVYERWIAAESGLLPRYGQLTARRGWIKRRLSICRLRFLVMRA